MKSGVRDLARWSPGNLQGQGANSSPNGNHAAPPAGQRSSRRLPL